MYVNVVISLGALESPCNKVGVDASIPLMWALFQPV